MQKKLNYDTCQSSVKEVAEMKTRGSLNTEFRTMFELHGRSSSYMMILYYILEPVNYILAL